MTRTDRILRLCGTGVYGVREAIAASTLTTCMRCETYDPRSPYQNQPDCVDLLCHGYLWGCSCQDCKNQHQKARGES